MQKTSRIALTAHCLTFRKPDPLTRHLEQFKTIVIHGIAPGLSLAYEALNASTGVSHLEDESSRQQPRRALRSFWDYK